MLGNTYSACLPQPHSLPITMCTLLLSFPFESSGTRFLTTEFKKLAPTSLCQQRHHAIRILIVSKFRQFSTILAFSPTTPKKINRHHAGCGHQTITGTYPVPIPFPFGIGTWTFAGESFPGVAYNFSFRLFLVE